MEHAEHAERPACVLRIIPTCVFNHTAPIILGVEVVEGVVNIGTPICVPSQGGVDLGRISSLMKEHRPVGVAIKGDCVVIEIKSTTGEGEASPSYGVHFDNQDELRGLPM